MTEKVALVDLDGTYVKGNSFHLWIKFILQVGAETLSVGDAMALRLRLLCLCALRKLKLLDHSRFKYAVQDIWHQKFSPAQIELLLCKFMPVLQKRISPYVKEQLECLKAESAIIILTTAAPGEYACKLVEDSDLFQACIATPPASGLNWYDNIRDAKQKNTLDYLNCNNLADKHLILFTDHLDDLHIMENCQEVHLFPPISHEIASLSTRFDNKIFHVAN